MRRTGSWQSLQVGRSAGLAGVERQMASFAVLATWRAQHAGASFSSGSENDVPYSSFPPRRRAVSEADVLAQDIESLGRQRWNAHRLGKLNITAGELPRDLTQSSPVRGQPPQFSPKRSKLAFKEAKDRLARTQEERRQRDAARAATPLAASPASWTPSFHVPTRQPDGSITADVVLNLSEVAYTLDEMEKTLFYNPAESDGDAQLANRTASVKTTAAAPRSVVTAEDASLCGDDRPGPVTDDGSEPPATVSVLQKPPVTEEAASAADTHNEAPRPVFSAPLSCRWATPLIPCCFSEVAEGPVAEDSVSLQRSPLLSIVYDQGAASYSVAPQRSVESAAQLVTALSEALCWLEGRHQARLADLRAHELARDAHAKERKTSMAVMPTSVMLHFSSSTFRGQWHGTQGTPAVPLQPTTGELALSASDALDLAVQKERFLHRLATAQQRGLRVTAVVDENTAVLDTAADIFFACRDCYIVGQPESVVIGFPSLQYGVLPSPTTLRLLLRRLDSVHSNTQASLALLSAVDEVLVDEADVGGRRARGALAAFRQQNTGLLHRYLPPTAEILESVMPSLSRRTAGFWMQLGLLLPVNDEASVSAWRKSVRWLQDSARRVLRSEAPPSSRCGVSAPLEECWREYLTAACDAHERPSNKWRNALARVLHTEERCCASEVYKRALSSTCCVTHEATPVSLLYVRADTPAAEYTSTALHRKVEECGGVLTLVVDGAVPLKEKMQLLAAVRASEALTAAVRVVLIGEPATLDPCTSLLSCAAVLSPAGSATNSPAAPAPLLPSRAFRSVYELSLSRLPTSSEAMPSAEVQRVQAGGLQFLRAARLPFVLSSTGDQGVRLVAALVLELLHAQLTAPSTPVLVWRRAVEARLPLAEPLAAVVRRYGASRVAYHVRCIARERADPAVLEATASPEAVTQLVHQISADDVVGEVLRRPEDALCSPDSRTAFGKSLHGGVSSNAKQASHLVQCALLDFLGCALWNGTLRSAQDADRLSVVALSLEPGSGGLLLHCERQACSNLTGSDLLAQMEECASRSSRVFASLPLLRWMAKERTTFYELDERALQSARHQDGTTVGR